MISKKDVFEHTLVSCLGTVALVLSLVGGGVQAQPITRFTGGQQWPCGFEANFQTDFLPGGGASTPQPPWIWSSGVGPLADGGKTDVGATVQHHWGEPKCDKNPPRHGDNDTPVLLLAKDVLPPAPPVGVAMKQVVVAGQVSHDEHIDIGRLKTIATVNAAGQASGSIHVAGNHAGDLRPLLIPSFTNNGNRPVQVSVTPDYRDPQTKETRPDNQQKVDYPTWITPGLSVPDLVGDNKRFKERLADGSTLSSYTITVRGSAGTETHLAFLGTVDGVFSALDLEAAAYLFAGEDEFFVPYLRPVADMDTLDLFVAVDLTQWLGLAGEFDPGDVFAISNGMSDVLPGISVATSPFSLGINGFESANPYSGEVVVTGTIDGHIPEPTVLALLALGLGALGLARLRARRLRLSIDMDFRRLHSQGDGSMHMPPIKAHLLAATWIIASSMLPVGDLLAQPILEGTLATSSGRAIRGSELRTWIDEFIPAQSNRLLVLAECYGGNLAGSFAGLANTAVASATVPGQQAYYGGYDDDAARALKPGISRTAQTVHDAGVAGKNAKETPSTGGGLALGDFSLDDTDASGPIQSRHVLDFAGQPDAGAGRDNDQRDKIKKNFEGQINTTVVTAGGNGTGGWTLDGTAAGMRAALKQIGDAIRASTDSAKEQFIFWGGDHGSTVKIEKVEPAAVSPGGQVTFVGLTGFTAGEVDTETLFGDPANVPGFTVYIPFFGEHTHMVGDPFAYAPYFQPGDWGLELDNGLGVHLNLTDFTEQYVEYGDGIIGNQAGEGINLLFQLDEAIFINSFFDVSVDLSLFNQTGGTPRESTFRVTEFGQDTGTIAKVSEPSSLALVGIGVFSLLAWRWRPTHRPIGSATGYWLACLMLFPVFAAPLDARATIIELPFAEYGKVPNLCPPNAGICGAAAAINSFVFLRNTYPEIYGSLIPDWDKDGDVDESDQIESRDVLANGWDTRTGMYGPDGGTAKSIWEYKNYWFDDFAPGTTHFSGQVHQDVKSWYRSGMLTGNKYPEWDFLWRELRDGEDIELIISPEGGGSGHVVTLTGLSFDDMDGDGSWDADAVGMDKEVAKLIYLDPNDVTEKKQPTLSLNGSRLEFEWWGDQRVWYVEGAFTESVPIPATAWLLLSGIGAWSFLLKLRRSITVEGSPTEVPAAPSIRAGLPAE